MLVAWVVVGATIACVHVCDRRCGSALPCNRGLLPPSTSRMVAAQVILPNDVHLPQSLPRNAGFHVSTLGANVLAGYVRSHSGRQRQQHAADSAGQPTMVFSRLASLCINVCGDACLSCFDRASLHSYALFTYCVTHNGSDYLSVPRRAHRPVTTAKQQSSCEHEHVKLVIKHCAHDGCSARGCGCKARSVGCRAHDCM